jgi:phage baseplate assembly protein W
MAENILIGRGWGFHVGVDTTGGIRLAQDEPEIEESISIIIGTSPGERVMRPAFGCRIHELVFAPNNAETVGLARHYVEEALEVDRGRLNITVEYTVRGTKDSRSLVFPFYLIENE